MLSLGHLIWLRNYTFGALWGGWILFWLASARGNKRTATRTGPLWRLTVLAAVLVVWLGFRQFPEYVWNLYMFGMVTVLLIVKLKTEEALIARQFPEAYLEYRRRVKAIIPFLY
jgi:protein-S-isoprenylcysteine O-methyltransferase Ste14